MSFRTEGKNANDRTGISDVLHRKEELNQQLSNIDKEICDVLESLNNWKDFPKKRTNVYRSTLDELKKKFGER